MWKNIYANKNIHFHNYVINIQNFGPKHTYDLHSHFGNDSFKASYFKNTSFSQALLDIKHKNGV